MVTSGTPVRITNAQTLYAQWEAESSGGGEFECTGDCSNAITCDQFNNDPRHRFNTVQAMWFKVERDIGGWRVINDPNISRTVYVNGKQVQYGEWPLPERADGAYYFKFSNGETHNITFILN